MDAYEKSLLQSKRVLRIAALVGSPLTPQSRILDFGCGEGAAVYRFREQGYDAMGFDVEDRLALRSADDAAFFRIGTGSNQRLPFDDNSFDFIVSDQVFEHVKDPGTILKELYRIMRPGGLSLHTFPSRYSIIEPHILVPFGSFFMHRWWYTLWAFLGVRNIYQRDMSFKEATLWNILYMVRWTNYVPNSLYEPLVRELGYSYRWCEHESFLVSSNAYVRFLAKCNSVVPAVGWCYRTFRAGVLALTKPL